VVLCYHSIHPAKSFASADPQTFDRHVRWLKENCEIVPFTRIRDGLPADARPRVAITFDDGYEDNYTHAFPILQRYGATATFFLIVGLLEGQREMIEHFRPTATREEIRPMNWDQAREMQEAGMDFGGHTWTHPNLALVTETEALTELVRSRDRLEECLQRPVRTMSYPFGKLGRHLTDRTVELARAAGYEQAAAILFRAVKSSDDPMLTPRFLVDGDDVRAVKGKVLGRGDLIGVWQERSPVWVARLLSPQDFRAPVR
jgi:peptidoglycan/xylan/chitin deacetylase (PgdA/CDA1 family)